jgi:hypothetical protein
MYRKKHRLYRIWYHLQFQPSIGGLETYPPWGLLLSEKSGMDSVNGIKGALTALIEINYEEESDLVEGRNKTCEQL